MVPHSFRTTSLKERCYCQGCEDLEKGADDYSEPGLTDGRCQSAEITSASFPKELDTMILSSKPTELLPFDIFASMIFWLSSSHSWRCRSLKATPLTNGHPHGGCEHILVQLWKRLVGVGKSKIKLFFSQPMPVFHFANGMEQPPVSQDQSLPPAAPVRQHFQKDGGTSHGEAIRKHENMVLYSLLVIHPGRKNPILWVEVPKTHYKS